MVGIKDKPASFFVGGILFLGAACILGNKFPAVKTDVWLAFSCLSLSSFISCFYVSRYRMSIKQIFFSRKGFNLIVLILFFFTWFFFSGIAPGKYPFFRLLYILFLVYLVVRSFYSFTVKRKDQRSEFKNGLRIIATFLVLIFWMGEGIFLFYAKTHGYAPTLAGLTWYYRYGAEENEWGFRDKTISNRKDKKAVLFTGDSFVWGAAIKNTSDRFPDLVQKEIGNTFSAYNLGMGGNDTQKEIEALKKFNGKAELVVASWIPDDIVVRAEQVGKRFSMRESSYPGNFILNFFLTRSYLLNALYWKFPHHDFPGYESYMNEIWKDDQIRGKHFEDIDILNSIAQSKGAKVLWVIFPQMSDPKISEPWTKLLEEKLDHDSIPFVDVRSLVKKEWKAEEWIVHSQDPHPNEALNKVVADGILEWIKREGLLRE